ncbi:4-alpha-glucanotransferase, partial [Streptococcus suis]
KEHFGNKALTEWDDVKAIKRDPATLATYRKELEDKILFHKVVQYFFDQQWYQLKKYANTKGIEIIGDMPIYV